MKIGVTVPIYISNPERRFLDLTTRSIISAEHEIVWMPCENYVHPVFKPLAYAFDRMPYEIRILHPIGKQSVSQAWNLLANLKSCPENENISENPISHASW
jgi:hypothetical protein